MPKFDDDGNEVDQGLGAFSAVYEHGCGHMDSSTCLEDLHRACVRDGVDFRFKTKVAKFTLDGGRCTGAQLADGSAIEAAACVEINQCVECSEEPASPRHRADVASMA